MNPSFAKSLKYLCCLLIGITAPGHLLAQEKVFLVLPQYFGFELDAEGQQILDEETGLPVQKGTYVPGGFGLYDRFGVVIGGGWPEWNNIVTNANGTKTIPYRYQTGYPAALEGALVSYGFAWDPAAGEPSPFAGEVSALVPLHDGTILDHLPNAIPPTLDSPPTFIPNGAIVDGSLDVVGSLLNLGTNPQNAALPGTVWVYDSQPWPNLANSQPDRLRSRFANGSQYEWVWEVPANEGGWTKLMRLGSHPSPALRLAVPIEIDGQGALLTATAATEQFFSRSAGGLDLGSNTEWRPPTAANGSQIVLGRFNKIQDDGGGLDRSVFVVGSGTGTGQEPRINGLRILDDGTVLIAPKGDLLMSTDFQSGLRP